MASLRNAVKRITHKERAQPQNRRHLGLLEKHGDYKKRARDYHRKQDRLTSIRLRASMRNPDEFYMGMHNSQVREGKHRRTEEARRMEMEDKIGADAVKVMKNQDLSYVRLQRQRDAKKIERLQSSLHFVGADDDGGDEKKNKKKGRKHTIFVSDEKQAEEFDPAAHFDTLPEFAGRAFNRPRIETLVKAARAKRKGCGDNLNSDVDEEDEEEVTIRTQKKKKKPRSEKEMRKQRKREYKQTLKVARARAEAYAELEARNNRQKSMALAESHLVTEKLVAGKGRKRKIADATDDGRPAVYKWRRKRAR